MMGEKRVTRWLGSTIDEDLEGDILWNRLITFLEKESKLKHEKLLIKRILDSTKPLPEDCNKSRSYWSSECHERIEEKRCTCCSGTGYLISHGDGKEGGERNEAGKRCYFCNESGHVEVNITRGTSHADNLLK